jgi:hypothetical protein
VDGDSNEELEEEVFELVGMAVAIAIEVRFLSAEALLSLPLLPWKVLLWNAPSETTFIERSCMGNNIVVVCFCLVASRLAVLFVCLFALLCFALLCYAKESIGIKKSEPGPGPESKSLSRSIHFCISFER